MMFLSMASFYWLLKHLSSKGETRGQKDDTVGKAQRPEFRPPVFIWKPGAVAAPKKKEKREALGLFDSKLDVQ